MNIDETTAFKARVAEALKQLDTRYKGDTVRYGGLHESAAVLVWFDPDKLRPSGVAGEEDIEDVLANSTLEPGPKGADVWSLRLEVRTEVLRQLGTRGRMLQALAANPDRPSGGLQRMLEACIRQELPALHTQDLNELTNTFQAVRWLHPIFPDLPDPDSVTALIELATLLRPLDELGGAHFSGRKAELAKLQEYVGVIAPDSSVGALRRWLENGVKEILSLHEKPPLMIFGPGGMGKSALLSRFILDHVRLEDARRIPFVYLDFDRPELRADEPLTFLIEAVRQLGLQYPRAREACERIRSEWQTQLGEASRRRAATARASDASSGTDLAREPFLDGFRSLLATLDLARKPILFVLDTFEEVQYRSPAGVREVMDFLAELQAKVPRLRVVIAGRAPITGAATESLQLGELDAEAAQAYLQKKGVSDPEIARRLAARLGGNALTLRLASEVVAKEGVAALEEGGGLDQLAIQRQLFRRILSRIHNVDVRKLAHPGLVLRRVTPELIMTVLAGPCDIPVSDLAAAERLFEELKREISIVAPSDGMSVRHRPELRRIMLPLLERDRPDTVAQIHQLAVSYYESREDVVSRAEEIYHRVSLGESPAAIDARWISGVETHLSSALEDLKPVQRAYLAARLGVESDAETRAAASLDDWERDAERRMRDWLAHDDPKQALAVFAERENRQPGTVLDALAADAHDRLGETAPAIDLLQRAIAAIPVDRNVDLRSQLLFKMARLQLRTGDQKAAREALDQASALSTSRGALHHVETLSLRARLAANSDTGLTANELAPLRDLLSTINDEQLREDPALLREIAGLMSTEDGPLLARLVRLVGFQTISTPQRRALSLALAAWDAELSTAAVEQPGMLARSFGLAQSATLAETWTAFGRGEPREISEIVSSLLQKYPLGSSSPPVALTVRDAVAAALGAVSATARSGEEPRTRATPAKQSRAVKDVRLSAAQVRNLQRALIDAFPDPTNLQGLLRSGLEKALPSLTLASDYRQMTFDVVVTAQAEGWTADLLVAALNARPGNAQLQTLAQEVGLGTAAPPARELERIIQNSDGFLDIGQWRSRLGELEAQVCKVELHRRQGGQTWATGFLVAPDLVMTAYHVVEEAVKNAEVPDLICRFDYRKRADGHTYPGTEFRLSPAGWLVDHSPYHPSDLLPAADPNDPPGEETLDYALLRLEGYPGAEPIGSARAGSEGVKRGWIEVQDDGPALKTGAPIFILQHPAGQPLKLAIDRIAGLNATRTRVSYQADTQPGSAGAPCFSEDWRLIAMHHSKRIQSALKEGIPLDAIVRQLARRGVLHLLGGRGLE